MGANGGRAEGFQLDSDTMQPYGFLCLWPQSPWIKDIQDIILSAPFILVSNAQ